MEDLLISSHLKAISVDIKLQIICRLIAHFLQLYFPVNLMISTNAFVSIWMFSETYLNFQNLLQ